jgi:hypothetical protein
MYPADPFRSEIGLFEGGALVREILEPIPRLPGRVLHQDDYGIGFLERPIEFLPASENQFVSKVAEPTVSSGQQDDGSVRHAGRKPLAGYRPWRSSSFPFKGFFPKPLL